MMHKVWRALGLRHNIVEELSSLSNEVAMTCSRVVPGKHVMAYLILVLKDA